MPHRIFARAAPTARRSYQVPYNAVEQLDHIRDCALAEFVMGKRTLTGSGSYKHIIVGSSLSQSVCH